MKTLSIVPIDEEKYRLLNEIDNDWCDKAYEVLAELNELADYATCNNATLREKARDIITGITLKFGLPCLDFCLITSSIYRELQDAFSEKDVYEYFQEKYKDFLVSDWNIVNRHNDPKHKSDFWVFNGIEYVPVECKLEKFDDKAKTQLIRYMNRYDCEHGIAVAISLKTQLPDNIKFIQIDASDLRDFRDKNNEEMIAKILDEGEHERKLSGNAGINA